MGTLTELVAKWREAWNGDGDGVAEAHAVWGAMRGNARDSLHQMLFAPTPIWDGDHISKAGRDTLIEAGLAVRVCHQGEQGYTTVTYPAFSIFRLVMGDHAIKEGQKRARERFRALAQKTVSRRAEWLRRMWPGNAKRLEVLLGDKR